MNAYSSLSHDNFIATSFIYFFLIHSLELSFDGCIFSKRTWHLEKLDIEEKVSRHSFILGVVQLDSIVLCSILIYL